MTNGDKIRSMSDEELAKYIGTDLFSEPWCKFPKAECDSNCSKCRLKWLKEKQS